MESTGPVPARLENTARGTRRRTLARLAATVVLLIGVLMALAEFVLTAIDYPAESSYSSSLYPAESFSEWDLSPGAPVPLQVGETIGAAGFRGPGPSPRRAPRALCVACVGDEWTFGVGCALGDCYPSRLREELVARLVPEFASDVEVLNAGVPGCSPAEAVAVLNEKVLPHRPDVVVAMFGGSRARSGGEVDSGGRSGAFLSRFRLARLVDRLAFGERSVRGSGSGGAPDQSLDARSLTALAGGLRSIAKSSAAAGARLVLVSRPGASAEESAAVAAAASDSGSEFLDAAQLVRKENGALGRGGVRPRAAATFALIARRLSEIVIDRVDTSRRNR